MDKIVWEYHHHRSSFLPNANLVDSNFVSLISIDIVKNPQMHVLLQGTDSEGNLCNITQTTPIDISMKLGNVEHVHIGQNCSTEETEKYRALFKEFRDVFAWMYEEIHGINLSIMYTKSRLTPW